MHSLLSAERLFGIGQGNHERHRAKPLERVISFICYDPHMVFRAVLFDAAETLFTTRGSVGEMSGTAGSPHGCIARQQPIPGSAATHWNASVREQQPRTTPMTRMTRTTESSSIPPAHQT